MIVGYIGATMDLPHAGHVDLLKKAKSMCDFLVVVLNKDDFIERFKGSPPAMTLSERMEVVSSFKMVDTVDVNECGEDSKPMILKYRPRYIFIGDDYNFYTYCKQMNFDKEFLEENNIDIIFVPRIRNLSSTDIKRRIRG